nr:endonuclease/exonuclease/phosphatase family protein [Microlunatus panaciterrae]
MTYNTHHGADRRNRLDLGAIASTIESCSPDIVALQEVDRHFHPRSGHLDQPQWYAERLGMHLHFAPILVLPADREAAPDREYGLALLSRLPFSDRGHLRYALRANEPRGLLTAEVNWGGRTIRLVNTHLSAHDRRARRHEATELVQHLDQRQLPTVVAGDFNALSRAGELSGLRRWLTDAWRAGRGLPFTSSGRRIDYIWMSRELAPLRTWVVRSGASDHYPVVADLVALR